MMKYVPTVTEKEWYHMSARELYLRYKLQAIAEVEVNIVVYREGVTSTFKDRAAKLREEVLNELNAFHHPGQP